MGKKNKKISSSVELRRKRKSHAVSLVKKNPFEVRLNRLKHNVIGKKVKTDKGLPGVSRSKANEKKNHAENVHQKLVPEPILILLKNPKQPLHSRNHFKNILEDILKEDYQKTLKSLALIDNANSYEINGLIRLVRKKTLLKEYKQRFKSNLIIDKRFGEFDENLTPEEKMLKRFTLEKQRHHEKSEVYNLDDEEDELTHYGQSLSNIDNFDDAGLKLTDNEDDINANDVDDHFGGGLLTKKTSKDDSADQKRKLTKQEIMDEIVANSKKKKYERQQMQEQAFELTQRIDTQLGEIRSLLLKREDKKSNKTEVDDYDKTVNELFFEAKSAKASDRMKTEEEIAKEEQEKLEKLEKERRLRMLGIEAEDEEYYQSADAIVESKKKKDDRFEVRYKDGKMVMPAGVKDLFGLNQEEAGSSDSTEDEDDDNEDGEDDNDNSDNEASESDHEDIFSENDDSDKDVEEITSIKSDSDLDETKTNIKKGKTKKVKLTKNITEVENELPYTYKAPETLQDFLVYTRERSIEDILTILDRIRKCNHIKLGKDNKAKMQMFFQILIEYIDHLCKEEKPRLKLINSMASFLQQLTEDIASFASKYILKKTEKVIEMVILRATVKGFSSMFPSLKEVISILYPTSDLNHVITTPCLYTLAMVLSKAHFVNIKDIVSGLFLLNIIYNYVTLSKRYVPEIIAFIAKLLYQCAPTKKPMKNISAGILNLRITEKDFLLITKPYASDLTVKPLNITKTLGPSVDSKSLENNDDIRLSCIHNTLSLSKKICELYKDLATFHEIFEPCVSLLERLPIDHYPDVLKILHAEVVSLMKSKSDIKRAPMKLQSRKPIPLPLLEPSFDENYEVRSKRRAGDRNRNELEKLKYKHKKETKGAMREIRKDAHFLAKEQLQETLQRDAERRRKVKELERDLANERHEIRQMEKMNRKK